MTDEQKIKLAQALNGDNVVNNPFSEAKDVVRILRAYKQDMDSFTKYAREHNYLTPNVDKWYHTAAMNDATKGDWFRGLVALGAGAAKEVIDLPKYIKEKGVLYALKEGAKDLKNDFVGVRSSWQNPDLPIEQNNWINNLQTPTMRDIMPLYREENGKKIY